MGLGWGGSETLDLARGHMGLGGKINHFIVHLGAPPGPPPDRPNLHLYFQDQTCQPPKDEVASSANDIKLSKKLWGLYETLY